MQNGYEPTNMIQILFAEATYNMLLKLQINIQYFCFIENFINIQI